MKNKKYTSICDLLTKQLKRKFFPFNDLMMLIDLKIIIYINFLFNNITTKKGGLNNE